MMWPEPKWCGQFTSIFSPFVVWVMAWVATYEAIRTAYVMGSLPVQLCPYVMQCHINALRMSDTGKA